MTARKMRLGVFLHGAGHHIAAWRHPSSNPRGIFDLQHYIAMARTIERGLFDFIFLPDQVHVRDENPATLRQVCDYIAQFEPTTLLCALAAVTEHVGLLSTASTSFDSPYHIARRYASLDHLSGGRAGWNVVTSGHDSESRNFGMEKHYRHEDRYRRAGEFFDVVRGLWDSWEDDAFPRDVASGTYCVPDKMHVLRHNGEFFNVRGPLNVARSPQGYPVIAQAGASQDGRNLASRIADVIYSTQWTVEEGRELYDDLKSRMDDHGRNPDHMKIMPGVFPVVGRTEAEAQEKFEELQSLVDPVLGLSQLRAVLPDVDLSSYPLDGPLPDLPETNVSQTRQKTVVDMARRENLTIRQLCLKVAGARAHWVLVGSVERVADILEHRFREGVADGFNIMPATQPGGLDDFVNLVVPELQRRGLFRTAYEGRTLRENLGLPRPEHPARRRAGAAAAAQ